MSQAARSERPIRRWISTVRPLCLPLAASRSTRSGDEPGQHRVLGRHPALAAAAHPARHVLVDRRGAQHPGAAERDEHAAGGHLGVVALEGDRAQLVGGASVGAGHGGTPVVRRACGREPSGGRCRRQRRLPALGGAAPGRAGGCRGRRTRRCRRSTGSGAGRRSPARVAAGRARRASRRGGERGLVGRRHERHVADPSRRRSPGRGTGSACSRAAGCRRRPRAPAPAGARRGSCTSSPCGLAALDELDEAGARRRGQLDVGAGGRRRRAGRRPDEIVPTVPITPTRPVRGGLHQRPGAGLDDVDHRHRQLVAQLVERRRRPRCCRRRRSP